MKIIGLISLVGLLHVVAGADEDVVNEAKLSAIKKDLTKETVSAQVVAHYHHLQMDDDDDDDESVEMFNPPDNVAHHLLHLGDQHGKFRRQQALEACDSEIEAAFGCDGSSCVSCVAAANDDIADRVERGDTVTCYEFEEEMCSAITSDCGCAAQCKDEWEEAFDCIAKEIGCSGFQCQDAATDPPDRPSGGACDSEFEAAIGCDGSSCVDCVGEGLGDIGDRLERGDTVTCDEFEEEMCSAITSDCGCAAQCKDEWQEAFDCIAKEIGCSGGVQCQDTATNPPDRPSGGACDSEFEAAIGCDGSSCVDCVGEGFGDIVDRLESGESMSCGELEEELCSLITSDCGCAAQCKDEWEEAFDCIAEEGGCSPGVQCIFE